MSIEGKHAYRFVFLKSEQWKTVRLESLVMESAKCQICTEESISNDAHHIWYPENIYETKEFHLVILCRACHDFIHSMMPDCKTGDEETGRTNWLKFSNAIIVYRRSKIELFNTIPEDAKFWKQAPAGLRTELERLKAENTALKNGIIDPLLPAKALKTETSEILKIVSKWASYYADGVIKSLAESDYQI